MKRTTIFLPEHVEKDLHHYARLDNKPTASLVREALEDYVSRRNAPRTLPSFAGQFASGHPDTAGNHDDLLFRDLDPHGAGTARAAGPPSKPRRTKQR